MRKMIVLQTREFSSSSTMADNSGCTLVCSVLFLDVVGYSKKSVAHQHELKQNLNRILAEALETIAPMDRIILDTGDGAAIAFTGDPEDALFAALKVRDNAGDIKVRMGINLGPVRLVRDLNGQINIIGDGINAAHRVMSFCEPGELLVSRAFVEVASCLSEDHVNLFTPMGSRTDKHAREHEIFSIGADLHVAGTVGNLPLEGADPTATAEQTPPRSAQHGRGGPDQSAKVFDAGESLIISGAGKAGVEAALNQLLAKGARLVSPPTRVHNKWMATCEHPPAASRVQVTELGLKRLVTGHTREAVSEKVEELLRVGAVLVSDLECTNGVWTAVCETGRSGE
ncbi:MAG: adenylate/guanylate cyclase domain-containing protein [Betaproteobacteria bacterium]|nr:adenylate/guanylate cyclase domain-containing protein [Betaproteobacteria bacterium]